MIFDQSNVRIKTDNQVLGTGKRVNNGQMIFLLKTDRSKVVTEVQKYAQGLDLWHHRPDHADKRAIKEMSSKNIVDGCDLNIK